MASFALHKKVPGHVWPGKAKRSCRLWAVSVLHIKCTIAACIDQLPHSHSLRNFKSRLARDTLDFVPKTALVATFEPLAVTSSTPRS